MIEQYLRDFSYIISQNVWFAPVVALMAGVMSSFMPCSLSSVPLVIGYVGGVNTNNTSKAFTLSLVFAAGMAVTYTSLGVAASAAGRLIGMAGKWWYIALGVLMLLMALQTWEIIDVVPSTHLVTKSTKKGYAGAFAAGILAGVFSSPCSTPVLIVLLGIVAQGANIAWGVLLLLLYSLGHSTLVLAAGTSVGFAARLSKSQKYGTASKILKYFMGAVMLLLAYYMFYTGF